MEELRSAGGSPRQEHSVVRHPLSASEAQTAFLSAGSNLGDRAQHLVFGIRALEEAGIRPVRVSSFFETEPVGNMDQPWFLNIAVEAVTSLAPEELLQRCQQIEISRGRVRTFQGAPRTLDLDILLYEDLILELPHLKIPHPRMAERRFVLEPLAEIAPQILHPVFDKSIAALLQSCPDPSTVQHYSPGDPPSWHNT